jgi:hypothetical protein
LEPLGLGKVRGSEHEMRKMNKRNKTVVVAAVLLISLPLVVWAQNHYIGYTGFIVDGTGAPVGSPIPTEETLVFRIWTYEYPAAGATDWVWMEQHTVNVTDGEFSVYLGDGGTYNFPGWQPLSVVDFNKGTQYWLGITVGVISPDDPLDIWGTEMTPRKQLLFVPYAFRSNSVIIEARTSDPAGPDLTTGRIWLRTDL